MKVLRIVDWNGRYESHESRKIDALTWVKTPNGHNSIGFCELMANANGLAHYGAWNLILQLASKCPTRGLLMNGSGIAYDAKKVALVTRAPESIIASAIERLLEIGWLEWTDVNPGQPGQNPGQPGQNPGQPGRGAGSPGQAGRKAVPEEKRGEEKRGEPETCASATGGGIVEIDPDSPADEPPTIRPPEPVKPPPMSLMDWKAYGHGKIVVTASNRDEWMAMWRRWKDIDGWTDAWEIAYQKLIDEAKIWPDRFGVILDELAKQITD